MTVSNLPSAQGKNQSSVVHIRKVVTEQDLVERATKLQTAIDGGSDSLKGFAEERTDQDVAETKAGWKALLSLFKADSRDELVTLLGFSKSEIASRVAEAVETLKATAAQGSAHKTISEDSDVSDGKVNEPVVSFAEPERQETSYESSDGERDEKTPSEVSASVTSDAASGNQESTTTVPSLFGDDGPGTPQLDPGADFFSTISQENLVPHTNYGIDSSVAATIGSGPSSVTSESLKSNNFKIYPTDESDTDRLVTKALVLGDFESAVALCLSSDRFADAILLAVRGGPDLLQRTQKAYFERRTTELPYLRLFQSIVTNDLSDIVQNADLQEWREIFVVLCTFASQDEFAALTEELGRRLEFQYTIAESSENSETKSGAAEYRKNATLTYLAAARLERLVNIWIDELTEEENALVSEEKQLGGSHYSAHAHALQSFVEKVTVFRSATKYEDADLTRAPTPDAPVEAFKLANLYDRYLEYAELLTTQGLVKEAIAFLKLTPGEYKGSNGFDFSAERDRLMAATKATPTAPAPVTRAAAPAFATAAPAVPYSGYSNYPNPTQPVIPAQQQPSHVSQAQSQYQPYNPTGSSGPSYAPNPNPPVQQSQYPSVASYPNPPYNPQSSLTQPPHLRPQNPPQPTTMVPPPPQRLGTPGGTIPPPPPLKRSENGHYNDPPAVRTASRGPQPLNLNKPAAITSPFPNQVASPGFSPGAPYNQNPGQVANFPPPARPGSVQAQHQVGPPPQGPRMGVPPPGRPASRTGPTQPPGRMMSPPQGPPPPRQPTPGQYVAPPSRGPVPGQTPPPPGPYARPPGQQIGQPPAPNYGAPPPGQPGHYSQGQLPPQQAPQQQQGPYGPPPGAQQRGGPPQPSGPPQMGGPPLGGPPPSGPPGGPPGGLPRASSRVAARQTGPPPPKYRALYPKLYLLSRLK